MKIDSLIEEHPLIDLLQYLFMGSKTGVLKILSNGINGLLVIDGPLLLYAHTDNNDGEAALQEILSWKEGRYIFDTEEEIQAYKPNISLPLEFIILETLRKKDEIEEAKKFINSFEATVERKSLEIDNSSLTEEEKNILSLIENHKLTVNQIAKEKKKDINSILIPLSRLIKKGLIKLSH